MVTHTVSVGEQSHRTSESLTVLIIVTTQEPELILIPYKGPDLALINSYSLTLSAKTE